MNTNKTTLKKFIQDFFLCGLIGWCNECFWTGLCSIRDHKDLRLPCRTSVWMFPIYGMAAVLSPLSRLLSKANTFARGSVYTVCIFLMEFLSGSLLKKHHMCPWDYSRAKLNVKGVIRLDYAPVWFALGLLYEKVLGRQ